MILENYLGMDEVPSDFDTFWDNQLKMIQSCELKYTLNQTHFSKFENVEYYDLYFESFDGAKIYAKYIKPNTASKVPLMFYFHGYPGANRNWFEKSAFAALGYAVLAMDFRGQGGKSQDKGNVKGTTVAGHIVTGLDDDIENILYRKNILDMCMLVRIGKQLEGIDTTELVSNGGSQGGAFAISCAALNPDITKCITLYPFLSDFRKVYELDLDVIAYEGVRYYTRWFNQTGEKDDYVFKRLSYFDTKNFAHRVKAKTLFGASVIDTVCPIETQYSVYNRLNCEKKMIAYKKYEHENIPHFNEAMVQFLLED